MRETFDEQALIDEIAGGGEPARRALKALYFRYGHRFRQYFLRRGLSHSDAEDLCQECFIKICKSATSSIRAPRAWLWSVAKSVMLDHLRKAESRSIESGEIPASDAVPDDDNDNEFGLRRCVEQQFSVYEAEFPEAAQAIRWIALEGFNAKEVAGLLGRSHGATREWLSQVRRSLRLALSRCEEYLS